MINSNPNDEIYYPSKETVEKARIKDWEKLNDYATNNYEEFWSKEAEELVWFKKMG